MFYVSIVIKRNPEYLSAKVDSKFAELVYFLPKNSLSMQLSFLIEKLKN